MVETEEGEPRTIGRSLYLHRLFATPPLDGKIWGIMLELTSEGIETLRASPHLARTPGAAVCQPPEKTLNLALWSRGPTKRGNRRNWYVICLLSLHNSHERSRAFSRWRRHQSQRVIRKLSSAPVLLYLNIASLGFTFPCCQVFIALSPIDECYQAPVPNSTRLSSDPATPFHLA